MRQGFFFTLLISCSLIFAFIAQSSSVPTLPRYDHVVIVVEENHSQKHILGGGNTSCPYMQSLAAMGANMTQCFAETHPSEPNYHALFSGSTQGVKDDGCDYSFSGPNLARALLDAGLTFAGYSEDLPKEGATDCSAGGRSGYRKKHNPWVFFQGEDKDKLPTSVNLPFKGYFPKDFRKLPTVSFVIPNQMNDMHDGTPAQADAWLKKNLDSYIRWAKKHNSLLIVTWDEDDHTENNQIPTFFVGAKVCKGDFSEKINHYDVLRTILDMYGLPAINKAVDAKTITDIFNCKGKP